MTVQERIEKTKVYYFYVHHPKMLEGTGLTPMQIVEAMAKAKIVSKKTLAINSVCEYLKANYVVTCDDEQLCKVVKKAYEKVAYYEKMENDYLFSDLSPLMKPWYQCLFQKRMNGEFDY